MGKKSIKFSCFSTNQVLLPYFLTSLLHEAMHLFQRVEGNLSFFFYLFFPVEKKKDILFWSLSFFQPNFITSLTMVHLSLELHTSGLNLTQIHMHRPCQQNHFFLHTTSVGTTGLQSKPSLLYTGSTTVIYHFTAAMSLLPSLLQQ